MRVMEIREFGAPEMLVKAERPDPVLPASGSGEILIRVKASGINRPDVLNALNYHYENFLFVFFILNLINTD